MDVSLGLISKLVKVKSIQRALAPIASQVSLLIILTEQKSSYDKDATGKEEAKNPVSQNVSVCAANMAASINHFVTLGERETTVASDGIFKDQMRSACETLELAKTDLFVKAQRVQASQSLAPADRRSLCQAAKDVLQAVLKVLLVVDNRDVRHIVSLVEKVESAVAAVGQVDETNQLVSCFKNLTECVLRLKKKLDVRVADVSSEASCTQLLVNMSCLRKSVPGLSMAVQAALKYRNNRNAQISKDSVVQDMLASLKKIRILIQTGADESGDEITHSFVAIVDKVMDQLNEAHRVPLHPDIESSIVSLVRHSMLVAHFHWGSYRELIVSSCHRILQAKFRLLELSAIIDDDNQQTEIKGEYNTICETILDEVCDIEKHVNMTLMQLIVDTFMQTTQPLDTLIKAALNYKDQPLPFAEVNNKLMDQFLQHCDNICQIAQLVATSSTEFNRVKDIHTSVQCLERLTPDLVPAVVGVASQPTESGQVKLLRILVKRWHLEMDTILRAVDCMADPRVFLDMTEARLDQELVTLTENEGEVPRNVLRSTSTRYLLLSQRALQVGERVVNSHSDPVYRDGLNIFVRKLNEAINLARAAANDSLATPQSSKLLDTYRRRLRLLRDAVTELRQGLDAKNHPHILSNLRLERQREEHVSTRIDSSLHDVQQLLKKTNNVRLNNEVTAKPSNLSQNSKLRNKAEVSFHGVSRGDSPVLNNKNKIESKECVTKQASRTSGVGNVQSWPVDFVGVDQNLEKENELAADLGSLSEIQLLSNRLVSACRAADKVSTDELTAEVLGWTNHIIEAGNLLEEHCRSIAKCRELTQLVVEIDQQAPQVIQGAKFAVSGDETALLDLADCVDAWAKKLDQARIIVDVAADRWLMLTSALRQAVHSEDGVQLKVMTSSVSRAQQEMCQILLKSRFLTGSFLNGRETLEFLSDSVTEIENLAITITTSVDVAKISMTRTASDRWQLVQVCRDWAVAMTCAVAAIDLVSDTMEERGREAFPQLKVKAMVKDARLADTLQVETNALLELVECIVCGDDTLRARTEVMVLELNSALEDVIAVAKQSVTLPDIPQYPLFCRLKIGLARSRWTEKALEVRDLIRQNSREYGAAIRQLLEAARDLAKSDKTLDQQRAERDLLCRRFLETSGQLKQKSLSVVQLCTDLPRRAVIRSTLDQLAKLTTQITEAVKDNDLSETDALLLSDQWGSRVHKLMVNLRKVFEIRPGLVNEISRIAKGSTFNNTTRPFKGQTSPQQTIQAHKMANLNLQSFKQHASPNVSDALSQGSEIPDVLRDAQFLDFHLHKMLDKDENEGSESDPSTFKSKVIKAALEIARVCSNMALFTKGGGTFKTSKDLTGSAVAMAAQTDILSQFGQTLQTLTLDLRLWRNVETCSNQMNGFASQLNIIATALHNSAQSFEGDRMLARNASNLLHSVRQLFVTAEAVAVKGLKEPTKMDEITKEVISLLELCRLSNKEYLKKERNSNPMDALGLRRMEIHNPPTLASVIDHSFRR